MEIKRLVAVTLILSFCIIFVACGEEEDDGYITPRVVAEPITDNPRYEYHTATGCVFSEKGEEWELSQPNS